MLRSTVVLLLFAGVALAGCDSGTPEVLPPFVYKPAPRSLELGNPPAAKYRYSNAQAKPYIAQLKSPAKVNVLRDQVPDHPHHHGLMFAVSIEGVDFWSETEKCGREIDRGLSELSGFRGAGGVTEDAKSPSENEKGERSDDSENASPSFFEVPRHPEGFVERIDWVGPGKQRPLARETRTVKVSCDPDLGATLLTWKTELQPPKGKLSIKLTGSHYFGLGMRFVQSMDGADDFFTPDGKAAGETVRGNERLVRGKWCAYAAEVDGKPVTVAMFDYPENVRPAWWFIMAKAFAYMSATLNLHREPLVVEAGKPLTLIYGVAVWDGKVKAEEIEKLYVRWLELAKPAPATNKP